MKKKFYITTPIYYVNGAPHIGSAYTTIVCDIFTRYHKMLGEETHFLTGTDENATKVVEAAQAAGIPAMAFVDQLAGEFQKTWRQMHIDFSDFIRTTEERHVKIVQSFFQKLVDTGYVYKDVYEGWYSVSDETFFRDSEVENGIAKETGKPVRRVKEENYFFKLSAFGDRLLEYYRQNPEFWLPEFRANEVVQFINEGLRDMCITRRNTGWGIEVPGEPDLVIYVWFDALINYISASGWQVDDEMYQSIWPADVHLVAKEIFVRFHATLWPAMLMALELPLPKTVFGHGWWTVGGEKGSKSSGNLPHPIALAEEIRTRSGCTLDSAIDAVRFLLLREMRFGEDSEYHFDAFLTRFNSDLANDLGNILNRTLAMTHKFLGGVLTTSEIETQVADMISDAIAGYHSAMDEFRPDKALNSAWTLVSGLNKYADDRAPWSLAKSDMDAAGRVLYSMIEGVRVAALLVSPYMPYVADVMNQQLNIQYGGAAEWSVVSSAGFLKAGHVVNQPEPIFPRIDKTKEVVVTMSEPEETKPASDLITYDDFKKLKLKIAKILTAEMHPNANKLLKLTVDLGDEQRTIVAGIAATYAPEQLIGKQIVLLTNLEPAVIRGVESQGMLLAADIGGKAVVLVPDQEVPTGTNIK